jgi:Ca2+-binding RTX toxin-like protein
VTIGTVNDSSITLTTQDANTIGAATDVASASFASAFLAAVTPNYGADGAGSTVVNNYSLAVNSATSGLSSGGASIFLYLINGVVTGSTAATQDGVNTDNTIFSISVNSAGTVTLSQFSQIDHVGAGNNTQIALADGKVTLSATVTDYDGDTATATVSADLGGNIRFNDAVPVAPTLSLNVSVINDETAGVQSTADPNASNDVAGSSLPGSVKAAFDGLGTVMGYAASSAAVVNVTANYGADGPASSGAMTYALSVTNNGTFSGVSTTGGTQIFLYNSGSYILGRVGTEAGATDTANASGAIAFAFTVDSSTGVMYLAQYLSLNNPTAGSTAAAYDDQITLTSTAVQMAVTLTDADGDTSTSSINIGSRIGFQDDGPAAPTLTLNASVINDETAGVQSTADPNASNDVAGSSLPGSVKTAFDGFGIATGYAASSAAMVSVSASYGADGAATSGATTYALSVTNGTFSGVSTTAGTQIFLYNGSGATAGYIVGRVGTEAGVNDTPNASGAVAFAFTVDGSTGVVYLAQYLSLYNPTAGSTTAAYDDQILLNSSAVQMTVTVKDGDGDTNSSSINVGSQIGFQDDAPLAPTLSLNASVINDETAGVQSTADPNASNDIAGSSLPSSVKTALDGFGTAIGYAASSAAMVSVSANYGTDGAAISGATTYALSVANGTFSGVSTTSGTQIFLYNSGNYILGRVGTEAGTTDTANPTGAVAFAFTVDSSTGVVYLAQYLALNNPIAGSTTAAQDDQITLNSSAVQMIVTVKDGDGDTNSSTINVGGQIGFQDDAPTAPTLTLNSSVINDETAGVQSTADPNASNDIAGSSLPTGIKTAFDGIGTVMGYAVSSAAAVNVTASYGADGAATSGAMTYALNVTNGTFSGVSTTAGTQIFLYNGSGATAGYIVGRVGTEAGVTDTPNASGAIAFAFTVDSAGVLYLAQYLSINNPTAGNTAAAYDDQVTLASNAVQMVVTLTDADGDTNSSTLGIGAQIGFQDDSPTIGTFTSMVTANTVGSASGSFSYAGGADGLSQFNITGPSIAGVTYTQAAQADGTTTLTAKTSGGTTVFTLAVAADSTYTYNLITPQALTTSTVSLTTLVAGNSTFAETSSGLIEFSTTSGNTVNSSTQGFGVNDQRVARGEQFTAEFHTAGSLGVDDPTNSNPQLVKSVSLNYADVNLGTTSSDNFLTFTWTAVNSSTNQTATGTITINSSAAGSLTIDPGFTFNQLTVQGTGGVSGSGKGARFLTADYTYYVFPADTTLQFSVAAVDSDNDVSAAQTLSIHQVIAGTDGSYTLTATSGTETLAGHTGVNIADYSSSTSAISINLDDSGNASGAPTTFSSPTDGKIGGGDAAGDTLSGIQGLIGGSGNDYLFGNSSANTLIGGAGNDTINGEGGNDTIIGGKGNDTLTGGTGKDTFVWQSGDQGTSASPAVDTITDFSMTDGDVLNLSGLLIGATTSNLSNYLSFAKSGSNTILTIDIDGAGVNGASFVSTQQITLQGVSMSQLAGPGSGSNPTSASVIDYLLNTTHQLVIN